MLGLLRQLHRLHIQFCLEAESEQSRINYPRVEAHKNKDGYHHPNTCDVSPIDNKQIVEAVERARDSAKRMTDALGMAELLKKSNCWENPPTPVLDNKEELHDEDEFDDDALADNDVVRNLLQEDISADDPEDVASGVSQLTSAGIIENDLSDRLTALHKSSFKRLSGTSLPMFEISDASKKKSTNSKHCRYVEVEYNGKTLCINKITAVWLLQEGKRVSSDRLFRVRSKQPYSSDPQPRRHTTFTTDPSVCETIEVGNICVFKDSKNTHTWKMGRVLQFSFFLEKTKSSQQYRGTTCIVSDANKGNKIGVLCAWYTP